MGKNSHENTPGDKNNSGKNPGGKDNRSGKSGGNSSNSKSGEKSPTPKHEKSYNDGSTNYYDKNEY